MKSVPFALAAVLLAGTALAQGTTTTTTTPGAGGTSTTTSPGTNPNTGVRSDAGVVERNQGPAAASGDRNQAVTTTDANAMAPAQGANSFTEGQARGRMEDGGFTNVSGLRLDDGGVWRGTATRDGRQVGVWADYKGNVGEDSTARAASATTNPTMPGTARPDGTPGNPPGTAATRSMDRAVGSNMSGANPGADSTGTNR